MRRALTLTLLALAIVLPVARAADDPGRPQQWPLDRIGTARAQGAGIVVAVVDTGVDLGHVELRDRILPGIDLVDDDDVAQDANGHGTHVAGIVAAAAGNGAGIVGVAPAARILPVRALDDTGAGVLDDVVDGIDWAVEHGADVINISIGEETQTILGPAFADAIRRAWAAGVVPVVAAGYDQLIGASRFTDEPAIVVGATTRADGAPTTYDATVGNARWGMSAPGGEDPNKATPADAILSTYWAEGKTNQYAYDGGTSMAAPHVSGAVAVLLGLGLSPQEAVDRLLRTAHDVGAPGRDAKFGAGRLDMTAATDGIDPANEEPPPSPSPTSAPPTTAGGGTAPPAVGPGDGTPTVPTMTVTPGESSTIPDKTDAVSGGDDDGEGGSSGDDDDDNENKAVPAGIAGVAAAAAWVGAFVVRRRFSA